MCEIVVHFVDQGGQEIPARFDRWEEPLPGGEASPYAWLVVESTGARHYLLAPYSEARGDGTWHWVKPDGEVRYHVKGDDVLTQCAYCGAWQTTAGYVGKGPLVYERRLEGEQAGAYRVSHGVCPTCYEKVIGEYKAFVAARGREWWQH